jgi:hypothetical protein
VKPIENPFALKRPHAPVDIMERQSSFRNFPKMAESEWVTEKATYEKQGVQHI